MGMLVFIAAMYAFNTSSLRGLEVMTLEFAGRLGLSGLSTPDWAEWTRLAAMLLVGLSLALFLPRLGAGAASALILLELLLLLNLPFVLALVSHQWLPLLLPAVALLSGAILILTLRLLLSPYRRLRSRYAALSLRHARLLLTNHQLEATLQQLGECPEAADDECLALLYELGIAAEQRRNFPLASRAFADLIRRRPNFRDAVERERITREAQSRLALPGQSSAGFDATLVVDGSALQNPVLGRYRIEKELGRGAMGVVYLGEDPKIGRTVAIKTLSLTGEFEGEELEQVRGRFLREAETAGRLKHPNIVTIYDVGEEADLAYIAMDYLRGEGLDFYSRPEELLPVNEVLAIAEQVAEALDYAHGSGVVHRDIKPANIIYNRDTQTATVTDFGVAHLADSSKTRTGTVLGSPCYMAPEQLAGTRVDGRADLFALGVSVYQLLAGTLPFQADSIAQLMYKITNSRHQPIRKLRPEVSGCAARVVNKLLQKDIAKRYQSGAEVAEALRRCLKKGG